MIIVKKIRIIGYLGALLIIWACPSQHAFGNHGSKDREQVDSLMMGFEKRIEEVALQLSNSRFNDLLQDSLNRSLLQLMDSALNSGSSGNYPFNALTQLGLVKSDDNSLRIFTWFTLKNNNSYRYYGFIQFYQKSLKKNYVFRLTDTKENITNPENANLTPQAWYGALYYEMIENKSSTGPVYTLLGWDGNNEFSTKKIIDVLTFTENGKPKFGKPIFKVGKRKDKRLIFEYNKRATMMVSFDKEYDMIILDHLAPINGQDIENQAFYGPDLSYDALKYADDIWNFQSNIDYKRTKKYKKANDK
jgi:hypothetical protein